MKFITGRDLVRWLHLPPDGEGERRLDEDLENSFPASDPPSFSPVPARVRISRVFGALHRPHGSR